MWNSSHNQQIFLYPILCTLTCSWNSQHINLWYHCCNGWKLQSPLYSSYFCQSLGWVSELSCLSCSPIVFVIHLLEEQQSNLDEFLRDSSHSILCNPRIRILTYVAEKGAFFYDNYPINILRNIGIRNVRTSHFIVLDMDMWMSRK